MADQSAFIWKQEPLAEALVDEHLTEFAQINPHIAELEQELREKTSSRLFDWVDHLSIADSPKERARLEKAGFVQESGTEELVVFHHPGAQLPRIVLLEKEHFHLHGVAVTVESIADFLMVRGLSAAIEGSPLSGYRRCSVASVHGVGLWVVERRGTRTIFPTSVNNGWVERYHCALERWQTRPRAWEDEEGALDQALNRAREMAAVIGTDIAAWIVLEVERKYWEARNRAGQIQKDRQDSVGMGWANHDHHTFRSSRKFFSRVIHLFEELGFHCRERFYAGEEAGWGAQVMENPTAGLVLFIDVDLAPDEVAIDFAHQPLPERKELGTIGLWCALHGDSILQAGMHHLEAQFEFEQLRDDLSKVGVGMMDPFSNFPYLKQAFTEGEQWAVSPKRLETLLDAGQITQEEAKQFLAQGALGSHLENLQRREGYKGFNQANVSYIIKQTDPRAAQTLTGA